MKIYKNIKYCRICKNNKLKEVLNLKKQPTANQLIKTFNQKEEKIPLKLVFCSKCKTVQLSSTVSSKYLFSKYFWVTGTSNVAKDYCKLFVKRTEKKIQNLNYVLEIASNDGTLLNEYKIKNYNILGVDPAKNIVKDTNKKNIKTICGFFDYEMSKKIKKSYGSSKLIIARNVIPHVENIHSMLKGINFLSDKNGVVAIEFHYLYEILKGLQYDSIYHEHLFYFSLKSISNLFKKHKLYPFDYDKSPISGGSIVLYFSKHKKNKSKKLINLEKFEELKKINNLNTLNQFGTQCRIHSQKLKKIIHRFKGNIIGYGASARSSTLLNFSDINYNHLRCIIDKNPLKDGYYTPGSKIKIINWGKKIVKKNSVILILAWNFKKEIIKQFSKNLNCKFIIPFPNRVRIYEN